SLLAGHHVVQVAAGGDHTLFLTDAGRVLACGRNDCYQLGDGYEGREAGPEPQQVSTLRWKRVVEMACGDAHNLVRCLDGSVYSWGLGSSGRLGLGNFKSVPQPCKVSGLGEERCVSVAAGYYHSFAVMEGGKLFAWGNGTCGQLGTGKFESCCEPVQVEEPGNGQRWRAVRGGEYHSLGMTDVGSLWSWGLNNDGQLGHGDEERCGRPKGISELVGTKISCFSCGPNFNVAISNGSQVFSWGNNRYGQLGHGDKVEQIEETLRSGSHGPLVLSVSCGGRHVLGLDRKGRIWAWGCNESGCLGIGDNIPRLAP
ncbi:hypothetical protein GUITHDRAFT_40435, partial [Guillardia theta CCMP2712]